MTLDEKIETIEHVKSILGDATGLFGVCGHVAIDAACISAIFELSKIMCSDFSDDDKND